MYRTSKGTMAIQGTRCFGKTSPNLMQLKWLKAQWVKNDGLELLYQIPRTFESKSQRLFNYARDIARIRLFLHFRKIITNHSKMCEYTIYK